MTNLHEVDWTKIPAPEDDGAARHLPGRSIPSLHLAATDGSDVNLATLRGRSIVYAYPMTGRPDIALPDDWDSIPGARGCTPQSCSFRDHADELATLNVNNIFGLSTQSTNYQQEAALRLHLPFALISDCDLAITGELCLPTLRVQDMILLKRLTMIIDDGVITKVFYPVFPPDKNVDIVLDWLANSE